MSHHPPLSLEQALLSHGDDFFRVALLLAGDTHQAANLLRTTARRAAQASRPTFTVPDLLALLMAAARETLPAPQRTPPNRHNNDLYQAIVRLPLRQRQSLALHMLLGYDTALAAQINAASTAEERATLRDALQTLAATTTTPLPTATPTEQCLPLRQALMDEIGQTQRSPALRGHLATCSTCRNFDQAWATLSQTVEAVLRTTLRDRTLPPNLLAKLHADIQPRQAWHRNPALRLGLPPLLVLLFIGALVLPGFLRSTTITPDDSTPLADPRDLVQRALEQVNQPADGPGVWHAQWDIDWYFPDGSYAPLHASAWIDVQNPARHRLQLVHADGGAPYELQLTDGKSQFWYALDSLYYSSIYGKNPTLRVPYLTRRVMDAATQQDILHTRLHAGAWDIGPAYLRQALAASNLRTLGRQRDGSATVQILSFSGLSPLGLPPDAPMAPTDPVTILLALDTRDARLRRVTELIGPAGSTQTSRTTWHLRSEEWLISDTQIVPSFDINRAWTGRGIFSSDLSNQNIDLDYILVDQEETLNLAQLLTSYDPAPWLPRTPPPGTNKALIYQDIFDRVVTNNSQPNAPFTINYRGPGHRLTLHFSNTYNQRDQTESLRLGAWSVQFQAMRGQRYRIALQRLDRPSWINALNADSWQLLNNQWWMIIDAQGYTRAELITLIEDLRPFDLQSFNAQIGLFARPAAIPSDVYTALLQALAQVRPPATNELLYQRERFYWRQNPEPDRRNDPYHFPRYLGLPDTQLSEQWVMALDQPGTYTSFEHATNLQGNFISQGYISPDRYWYYMTQTDALMMSSGSGNHQAWFSYGDWIATQLLAEAPRELSLVVRPDGSQIVRYSRSGQDDPNMRHLYSSSDDNLPFLYDLWPQTLTTELLLDAASGRITQLWLYGEELNRQADTSRMILSEWQLLETAFPNAQTVPPDRLVSSPPSASIIIDQQISGEPFQPITVQPISLADARALSTTPLWVLPDTDTIVLEQIQVNREQYGATSTTSFWWGDDMSVLVNDGLAFRFDYQVPNTPGSSPRMTIFQGPTSPIRNTFRQVMRTPWTSSEPRRLNIAGRDIAAWLMRDDNTDRFWVFAELDDTFLIVEGRGNIFLETLIPLLATLRPAS